MADPPSPDTLARALDYASDVVARFDRHFRHLYVNDAITRHTGHPPEHFIGRSHRELGVPAEYCDIWESRITECFEGREVRFILTFQGASGRLVHDVLLLPDRDPSGEVQSVLGVGHDLTISEVAAERARLATIVGHIADGLIVGDLEGRVLDMNPAALRMHGFKAAADARIPIARYDELFRMRTPEGEVLTSDRCPLARALRGETFAGVELHVEQLDTGATWIGSFAGAAVRNQDGRVTLGIVTVHDVTERRRLETELAEREERYRLVTEAMEGIVYDADLVTGTVTRSARLADVLGYDPHEVPATQGWWLEQLHPDDLPAVLESRREAVARQAPGVKGEYRVRHKDGAWVWVWDHSRLLYDDERRPVRILGCTVSVDARKRAEDRLREMDRLKDQFLMMLGHELRQPLHAMRAANELVRLQAESGRQLRPLAVIDRQIEHLARLVEDLGDVSRVKRGKLRITDQVLDLRETVESALEAVRARCETERQELRWDPPPEPVLVRGDRGRLQQVVLNLLSNAHGHTPPGGHVHVTLRHARDAVELAVHDSGTGIAPELLPHVFDLFVQGSDRDPSGMGIGLALVKGLVELHGGSVEASSGGPGRGSTFRVTLPATPLHPPAS